MIRRTAIVCLCPLAVLVGCGNARTPLPDLSRFAQPNAWATLTFQGARFRLDVPRNWTLAGSHGQLAFAAGSGRAVFEVWWYPRSERLPTTSAQLRAASRALVQAARVKDPRLHVIRSRALRFAGAPAAELSVTETVSGQLRRDRTLHVFGNGEELVLDAYAPASDFHAVDHAVFSRVRRSLRLL